MKKFSRWFFGPSSLSNFDALGIAVFGVLAQGLTFWEGLGLIGIWVVTVVPLSVFLWVRNGGAK